MSSTDKPDEFKQRFQTWFSDTFEADAANQVDFPALEQLVTFNFDDQERDRVFFQRMRHFVALLLRTREMDQFVRSVKTQFSNTAQNLYDMFLDVLFENSQSAAAAAATSAGDGSQSAPSKKDVFKHLNSIEECKNSLVIQMVIYG